MLPANLGLLLNLLIGLLLGGSLLELGLTMCHVLLLGLLWLLKGYLLQLCTICRCCSVIILSYVNSLATTQLCLHLVDVIIGRRTRVIRVYCLITWSSLLPWLNTSWILKTRFLPSFLVNLRGSCVKVCLLLGSSS